ncbi:hypothetical protein [Pseudogemmobacter hezensis]|uniref:hypothetical protein n=1 Tax=Pseudogemmobacter hezensis TaxID=2737662 RepID=UPI001C12E3DD|nr:hypothetical protein [Pseudogemmobacter hezensis]
MKRPLTLALLPVLAAFAGPSAARTWSAPEGCEINMTVQAKGCRVSNHYICSNDAKGDQWRADFDQEGLFFQSRINFETQWVESISLGDGEVQYLGDVAEDPASFSELLDTGLDTFDFTLTRNFGPDSRVIGFDRLTGRSITIDGVVLEETEFEATEADLDGNPLRASRGHEYISRDKRMFFAGPGQTDLGDGQWVPIDGSPIDFIFPGEPGFAATRPLYDCDPLLTNAPAPQGPAQQGLERLWRARYGE